MSYRGLVTGIGSMPHDEAKGALDLIFKYCPNIPFWPQLPKRNMREGMLVQYSENLPCGLGDLEAFYEHIINEDVDYFKITPDFAAGLYAFHQRLQEIDLKDIVAIKGQVVGPFTLAASLVDENKRALLHDEVFLQAIIKGLSMKARWQIEFFKKFNKQMIIFFDEPYLGCFGSAYTPIQRDGVIKGLNELTEGVKSSDALFGIHCCGNTDWSILTEAKDIKIISFDAFSFLDRFILYAQELKEFLGQGGLLCWGIAPTQEYSTKVTPETLKLKIEEGITALVKKGLDRELILERSLLSPACGLSTLEPQKAEDILRLLSLVNKNI